MGHNKFLSLYPQLWEPKIGDKVILTSDNRPYWKKGDVGEIIKIYTVHTYTYYKIDFNNSENKEVYLGGRWDILKVNFGPYHGS